MKMVLHIEIGLEGTLRNKWLLDFESEWVPRKGEDVWVLKDNPDLDPLTSTVKTTLFDIPERTLHVFLGDVFDTEGIYSETDKDLLLETESGMKKAGWRSVHCTPGTSM